MEAILRARAAKNFKFGFTANTIQVPVGDEVINTYYIEKGDPRSPPLLLLHGLGGSASNWLFNGELASKYRLIAPDLPGFGLTPNFQNESNASLEGAMLFLMSFTELLDINKYEAVFGNSMGGFLAIHFTNSAPHLVNKLVLLAPGGIDRNVHPYTRLPVWVPDWLWNSEKLMRLLAKYLESKQPTVRTGGQADRLFANPELIKHYAQDVFDDHPFDREWIKGLKRAALVGMDRFGQRPSAIKLIHSDLEHITCPMLVVWGNQDKIIKPKHAHRLKEIASNAKLVLLTDCGHLPQIEQHEVFNEIAWYFLNDPNNFESELLANMNLFGLLIAPNAHN